MCVNFVARSSSSPLPTVEVKKRSNWEGDYGKSVHLQQLYTKSRSLKVAMIESSLRGWVYKSDTKICKAAATKISVEPLLRSGLHLLTLTFAATVQFRWQKVARPWSAIVDHCRRLSIAMETSKESIGI